MVAVLYMSAATRKYVEAGRIKSTFTLFFYLLSDRGSTLQVQLTLLQLANENKLVVQCGNGIMTDHRSLSSYARTLTTKYCTASLIKWQQTSGCIGLIYTHKPSM